MKSLKPKDLRNLSKDELEHKLSTLKEELFNLQLARRSGRLEKPSRVREIKKDIARINTCLNKERPDVR